MSDLLTSEVNWPTSPLDMRPSPPPKPAKPREHQREAIRDVVKGFTKSDRGQLIMACGTGKTLTSLFIKEKLAAERTLVLVPSLSLLKQTMQVWRVNAKVPFEALPVCSDETVGRSEEDAAVAHTSELGVPVTTDPHDIAAFLRRRSGPRVVFSTYQSSPQIAERVRPRAGASVRPGDRRRGAQGRRSRDHSDFATVLDETAIKARRRLFMTATPRYFTGRVLKAAQEADLEVASMDDPSKFGTVFHRLTFGEAIKRDLLTDYQVAVVGVDNDDVPRVGGEGHSGHPRREEDHRRPHPGGTDRAGEGDAEVRPSPHHHLPLPRRPCPRVRRRDARGHRLDACTTATEGCAVVAPRLG